MFGMGMVRRQLAKEGMEEIGSWLIGQSMRFSAEVNQRFKEVPPLLAATEGLGFFLHALRREAFRPEGYKVWVSVFEPGLKQTIQIFAATLNAWTEIDFDRGNLAQDVQNLVSSRNLEYQTVPFLSDEPGDRQTVIWNTARRLGEVVDPARREFVIAFVEERLRSVVETELPEQAARLERLLYGRHAA